MPFWERHVQTSRIYLKRSVKSSSCKYKFTESGGGGGGTCPSPARRSGTTSPSIFLPNQDFLNSLSIACKDLIHKCAAAVHHRWNFQTVHMLKTPLPPLPGHGQSRSVPVRLSPRKFYWRPPDVINFWFLYERKMFQSRQN